MSESTLIELWTHCISQPVKSRHLDLCRSNSIVRSSTLQYIAKEIQRLNINERPQQITVSPSQFHISGSICAAKCLAEILRLCEKGLERLNISWCNSPEVSTEIIHVLAKSMTCLHNLNTLQIISVDLDSGADLLAIFSSVPCNVHTFTIYYEGRDEHLSRALTGYRGLKKLTIDKVPMSDAETCNIIKTVERTPSRLTAVTLPFIGIENSNMELLSCMMSEQVALEVLDLSHNPVFQAWNENLYETSNQYTHHLSRAVSNHSSLRRLVMRDCHWNNETFVHLLQGISESSSLEELELSSLYGKRCTIENDWLEILPRLKNLKLLHGLDRLLGTERWKAIAVPLLRKNTSLSNLTSSGGDKQLLIDAETSRILSRNKLFTSTRVFKTDEGGSSLALSLWPPLMAQMASPSVDQSAFFSFLQEKIHELHNPGTAHGA